MQKMINMAFWIALCSVVLPCSGFCDTPISYEWQDKLGRGAANIFTGFFEIPREIHYTTNEKGLGAGWTVGLVRGFGISAVRMGYGFVDLFTFPFDFPEDHKAPLIDPEYAWESGRTVL